MPLMGGGRRPHRIMLANRYLDRCFSSKKE